MVLLTGIYTNGPYCIFVQSEVDLGTVLSAMVVILAAGVISSAWCRYLCPEGAVLGWLARHSRWKIVWAESRCDACRACEPVCPVEAIRSGQYDPTTCIFCSRCVEVCPREALRIEAAGAPHPQSRTGETPSGPPPPVP
jgi:polyferredoxin